MLNFSVWNVAVGQEYCEYEGECKGARRNTLSSDDILFSDKLSDSQWQIQIICKGWTESSVRDTVNNHHVTRASTNLATNNPATAYFNKDGSYVVVDNVTSEVVQVSHRLDLNWIPDSNIVNPYIP